MNEYTIDATNGKLGRLASEAATKLMGKNTPEFRKNIAPKVKVTIINASKLDLGVKKRAQKTYQSYSGYPGGRREWTMDAEIKDRGYSDLFRKAVTGMLPGNKLRPVMLKNLVIEE